MKLPSCCPFDAGLSVGTSEKCNGGASKLLPSGGSNSAKSTVWMGDHVHPTSQIFESNQQQLAATSKKKINQNAYKYRTRHPGTACAPSREPGHLPNNRDGKWLLLLRYSIIVINTHQSLNTSWLWKASLASYITRGCGMMTTLRHRAGSLQHQYWATSLSTAVNFFFSNILFISFTFHTCNEVFCVDLPPSNF